MPDIMSPRFLFFNILCNTSLEESFLFQIPIRISSSFKFSLHGVIRLCTESSQVLVSLNFMVEVTTNNLCSSVLLFVRMCRRVVCGHERGRVSNNLEYPNTLDRNVEYAYNFFFNFRKS